MTRFRPESRVLVPAISAVVFFMIWSGLRIILDTGGGGCARAATKLFFLLPARAIEAASPSIGALSGSSSGGGLSTLLRTTCELVFWGDGSVANEDNYFFWAAYYCDNRFYLNTDGVLSPGLFLPVLLG